VGKQYARLVPQIEGRKYDPDGDYVKRWVPELKDVNREYVHRPWKMDDELQEKYNVRLGVDYPHPIRDPSIGDIRRKRRYMKRLGKEWPLEEEKTDIKNIASNRQDEDWYGENEHEERKSGTKWSVSLDEADDEEFTSRQ
jgi:FAD binding domain of DNA photolyase